MRNAINHFKTNLMERITQSLRWKTATEHTIEASNLTQSPYYIVPCAVVLISRVTQSNNQPRSILHFSTIVTIRQWSTYAKSCWNRNLSKKMWAIRASRIRYARVWSRNCIQHWPIYQIVKHYQHIWYPQPE